MTQKHGLSAATVSALRSVFAKHPGIERVILYGSRAMGSHRPGSDIDLVLVAPTLDLTEQLKIETEIDELNLPYQTDLSLLHLIENDSLLEHIRRVGVELA